MPCTVNGWVAPKANDVVPDGVIASDESRVAVTVSVVDPTAVLVVPVASEAMISVVPALNVLTTPVVPTVAIDESAVVQVTYDVTAWVRV